MKKFRTLFLAALLILALAGCGAKASGGNASVPPQTEKGALTVSFDYQAQSGHASNQFAIWIEDASGKLVKTLYATKFTANGGYSNRPDSIKNWVAKSGLADMTKTQVDAVSGATPKTGKLTYTWDLTDSDGNAVSDGSYTYMVEGTIRWKNYILFSGVINIGGGQATVVAAPSYHFEADDSNNALTESSIESSMISNVTAEYIPAN